MQPQEITKIPLRERERLKPSPWRKVFAIVLYSVWLALFLIGGTVLGMFGKNEAAKAVLHAVVFNVKAEDVFKQDSMNILLLGCDEDLAPGGLKVLKQAGRADMIMVAHLDFKNKTITGISIPRDTRCQLPGQPSHKLNAYHNLAKPSEAKQKQEEAVEYLTGVNIDRTIVLDYVAFQKLIDTVGKVTVMITDKMDYDDNAGMLHVHFKPGLRTLDGYDAMCYVRFRKDKGGDFKRTERQRQLLMAFKSKVIQNWQNLPKIIDQGVKVLGPDTFTNDEVAALAVFSKGVTQANIKMLRLPTTQGEGSFEELDKSAATKLLSANGFLNQEKQKENDKG
jgi:LCP family protein required for cell wall assembly